MSLKEYFNKSKKEDIYSFYCKLTSHPKEYNKITRNDIYNNIISLYKENPEIILHLCTSEEIHVLKSIINNKQGVNNNSYIEYNIYKNLEDNFLIIKDNNYIIPKDILNFVKMALNLYNEKEFNFIDVFNSLVIGLLRIYNVLSIEEFHKILSMYGMNIRDLNKDILENIQFKDKLTIIKYKKKEYIVSLENNCYKDILKLRSEEIEYYLYTLEEVISIGKYKINLFNLEIFEFLNFLEVHLDSKSIDMILDDIIVYSGFDIDDEAILCKISDNIKELYEELKKVINNFPVWIYKGNSIIMLKKEVENHKTQSNLINKIKKIISDILNWFV